MQQFLKEAWKWWCTGGSNAAAVQQLFFILLTTIATVIAIVNLSAWKRQQRASLRATAINEVFGNAALVCDHMLIERISYEPMACFPDLTQWSDRWLQIAKEAIENEKRYWKDHVSALDQRIKSLGHSIQKNQLVLHRDLKIPMADLRVQVDLYKQAIIIRTRLIEDVGSSADKSRYQHLVGLRQLAANHPLLWRKSLRKSSVDFEQNVSRARDALRAELSELY